MDTDLGRLLDMRVAGCSAQEAFTFLDFAVDRDGHPTSLSWSDIDRRACALAALMQGSTSGGARAVIAAPNGIDYLVGFLACLRAGVIAVPAPSPAGRGQDNRVASIVTDCRPDLVLTTAAEVHVARRLAETACQGSIAGVIAIDQVDIDLVERYRPVRSRPDDVAYLQYTSGSTGAPSGVIITHRNLIANMHQAAALYVVDRSMHSVSWLPLFHDMGLALTIGVAVVIGCASTFTSPFSFVHHPSRWLRMLGAHDGTFSAAPDFAYAYCVKRISAEEIGGVDLSGVRFIIDGSEPIKAATVRAFQSRFSAHGLPADVVRPSYGLAEATVFVTGARRLGVSSLDAASGIGKDAQVKDPGSGCANEVVSCGIPAEGTFVCVVDVESGRSRHSGQVGEIWVHGASVGQGYWGHADRSNEVFGGILLDPPVGAPSGPWLRTGDLGIMDCGQLYVTGRLKDVIIVDGANHYPSDIEQTIEASHPAFRRGRVAAFGVNRSGRELVIVVAEIDTARIRDDEDLRSITRAARRQATAVHSVRVFDILPVRSGTVPLTSSGKIQRALCRSRYEAGWLEERVRI